MGDDDFGRIVGEGLTRDIALAAAVTDLEAALDELQGPPPFAIQKAIVS